jgi:uncharacterized protein YacL (UPF0231 family)
LPTVIAVSGSMRHSAVRNWLDRALNERSARLSDASAAALAAVAAAPAALA